jgi:hypothetical protein
MLAVVMLTGLLQLENSNLEGVARRKFAVCRGSQHFLYHDGHKKIPLEQEISGFGSPVLRFLYAHRVRKPQA